MTVPAAAYEAQMRIEQLVLSLALGLSTLAGCGDDHDHGDEGDAGDHHHHGEELTEACQAITDACHDIDDGTGEAAACHVIAHENHDDDCVSERTRCVALCDAAAADGGSHHDEDAGHDES